MMLRVIASTACDVYDACVLALHRVYLFVTAYARLHYTRFPPPASDTTADADWTIHKVLAFCEDTVPLSDSDIASTDFANVTEWFDINTWDIDVARTFPDWFKWKLEIRYMHRGEKFRHVIRPGDPLTWPPSPPASDPAAEHRHLHELSKPKGILSASLVPRPGIGASEVDITHRLRKYAGVTRDFTTASEVRAHDAFPMDDNDWNAQRFRSIRIVKAHPVKFISIDDVNYAENGLINEKKKE